MPLLTEKIVEIRCPADELFAFICNMENFASWFPGVLEIRAEDSSPHGRSGKIYLEKVKLPTGGIRIIPIKVVEALAPTRFATEGKFPPLHPRMEVTIESLTPTVSRLTWRMHSRNESILFRFTLLPLFRLIMSRRAAAAVKKLKHLMESSQAPIPGNQPC